MQTQNLRLLHLLRTLSASTVCPWGQPTPQKEPGKQPEKERDEEKEKENERKKDETRSPQKRKRQDSWTTGTFELLCEFAQQEERREEQLLRETSPADVAETQRRKKKKLKPAPIYTADLLHPNDPRWSDWFLHDLRCDDYSQLFVLKGLACRSSEERALVTYFWNKYKEFGKPIRPVGCVSCVLNGEECRKDFFFLVHVGDVEAAFGLAVPGGKLVPWELNEDRGRYAGNFEAAYEPRWQW